MKYLQLFETFTNKIILGIDIDGTICNFVDGYNLVYKKYFPDKEIIPVDDWYWYRKLDYNGEEPDKWFLEKKAEIFDIAKPYENAQTSVNNIYDFIKSQGYTLNIITNQPNQESKIAAQNWLNKYDFRYDKLIFVLSTKEKWNYTDIMVDDADKVIGTKPLSKVSIKIEQLWNINTRGDFNIPHIKLLSIDIIKQAISKLKNNITI
jgi:uncharacterized HAD superfamily protein